MSTDTLDSPRLQAPVRSTALALVAIGAVLAVAGAALGSQMFFDARPYSAIATSATHPIFYVMWTACLIALSQVYPRLASLRGGSGLTIGPVIATAAGVGAALDACARFVEAMVVPYLGRHAPELLDTPPDTALLVPLLATGVVAMLTTGTLAVVGLRRRVLPVGPAVMLVVGAVALPAIGPLSTVLIGAALAWLGLRLRRTQ